MVKKLDGGLNNRETSLMGLNAGRKRWWGSSLAHTATHTHIQGLPSLLLTLYGALLHSSVPGAAKTATKMHKKQIEMLHWVLSPHDPWLVRCTPPPHPHPRPSPSINTTSGQELSNSSCIQYLVPCSTLQGLKEWRGFWGAWQWSAHSFKSTDCPVVSSIF